MTKRTRAAARAAVAAVLVGLTAAPAVAEPIVLRFAPGAITVRTRGTMSARAYKHRYSLDVRKGQTLTFNFEGGGPLIGEIDCKGENGYLGPLVDGDTFVVPQSGPCILTVELNQMAERWYGGFKVAVTAR